MDCLEYKGLLTCKLKCVFVLVLFTNIDQKLRNELHGPMYYKLGVTWVYNGHDIYTPL